MIEIREQEAFDSFVSNPISSEVVLIYPLADGEPYILKSSLNLQSKVTIRGVSNPKIRFDPSSSADYNIGMIDVINTFDNEIRGVHLIGNPDHPHVPGVYIDIAEETVSSFESPYASLHVGYSVPLNVGVTVKDVILENLSVGIMLNGSTTAISGVKTIDVPVGLQLSNPNTSKGNGNTITECDFNKVRLSGGSYTIINNNTIRGGLHLDVGSYRNTITGNTIRNGEGAGILITSSGQNVVYGNNIESTLLDGIEDRARLNNGGRNAISGNTIRNCGGNGISLNMSVATAVSNNTIEGSSKYGIHVQTGSNKCTLYGNTFDNNGLGDIMNEVASTVVSNSNIY